MPLAISGLAFLIFTALLLMGRVGEASYCFLAASSALLGLVLHGFGRLQELDLRNLRVVLRELKEAKEELFVREEQLKKIAAPLAQVIAFAGASEGRLGGPTTWELKRAWYKKKIEQLVNALGLSPTEANETLKFTSKYEEIDKVLGGRSGLRTDDPDYAEVKAKLEVLGQELERMLRSDLR